MTSNDSEEINRPNAVESVMWFFDHVRFGHLDEIPDEHLVALLEDFSLCGESTVIAGAGHLCNDADDPAALALILQKTVLTSRKPFIVFRSWLFMERARRLGQLPFDLPDILVREMPFNDDILMSKSKEIWKHIKKKVLASINSVGETP